MKTMIFKINQLLKSNELNDLYPQPYNVLCNWDKNGKSMDENNHTKVYSTFSSDFSFAKYWMHNKYRISVGYYTE